MTIRVINVEVIKQSINNNYRHCPAPRCHDLQSNTEYETDRSGREVRDIYLIFDICVTRSVVVQVCVLVGAGPEDWDRVPSRHYSVSS